MIILGRHYHLDSIAVLGNIKLSKSSDRVKIDFDLLT